MSKVKDVINSKYIGEAGRKYLKQMSLETEVFTYEDYLKCSKILYENTERKQLNDASEKYKLEKVNNPHDKIFRKLLDKKENAVEIINRTFNYDRTVLEKDIEKYNSSYITEELKNSECDVVFKKKDENVFWLIEHQTVVDYKMAYRMLEYKLSIIKSVIVDEMDKVQSKNYEYPLVIPIVLYTGKHKYKRECQIFQKSSISNLKEKI